MSLFPFIILIGLAVRLFLVGNPGFVADVSFWKSWSLAALDHGIVWTTYNTNINYPPGFIYILWLMGKLYTLFGDPHDYNTFWRENNFGFLLASKSIAIASDVAIAFLIYWFFSRLPRVIPTPDLIGGRNLGPQAASSRSPDVTSGSLDPSTSPRLNRGFARDDKKRGVLPLLLSSLFFLNPVVILDSALWGQVESFGILFTLVAIILLFYRRPLLATAIFTTGALMKLQNIIFIPIFFLFIFRYFDLKTTVKSLGVAAATFFFVNLPFLLANDLKQVLYLMTVNSDYFPWLSLNAHNLWWIVAKASGMQISDKITVLGILNAKTVGLLLFSTFYFLFSILVFLKPTPRNFLLSFTLSIFAFFLFTTQSHERYSYPVIVLLLFFYPFFESNTNQYSLNSKFKSQKSKVQFKIKNYLQYIQLFAQHSKIFADRTGTLETLDGKTNKQYALHGNKMGSTDAESAYLASKKILFASEKRYFWVLYALLTLSIFFNIHHGLILNYPQNGFYILTRLTTPGLSILNSYFLILLFFLLLPFVFSQISPLLFVICCLFFVSSLTFLHFPYFVKGQVSLTAFKPIIIKQDYGMLQINKAVGSFSGWKSWNRPSNNYFFYRKGFGTHANSNLVFDLDKKFKNFSADFGVDTEAGTAATVIFKIYGDGKQLFESNKMDRFDFPGHTEVDVTGIKYLGLIVEDAGDGINNDHADWLNPILYK